MNSLIISSGGNKGFALLGALLYLEEQNLLKEVRHYAGVSVGSIISLLLNLGFSVLEINKIGKETNLIESSNVLPLRDMLIKHGIFSQRGILDSLEKEILKKRSKVPTFKELFQETSKELIVVATNVSKPGGQPEYFSWKNHPDLLVTKACLMSSNIPGIFEKNLYLNDYFVDGALSDPYPILPFDKPGFKVLAVSLTSQPQKASESLDEYIFQCIQAPMVRLKQIIRTNVKYAALTDIDIPVYTNPKAALLIDPNDRDRIFTEAYFFAKEKFSGKTNDQFLTDDKRIIFDI